MKRRIIIGNWKMNPRTLREAEILLQKTAKALPGLKNTEVVICPPYLYFEKLKGRSRKIALGGQDAFSEEVGPYTGEVSATMLYELGARYVILGHSERRALLETDALINKKVKGALAAGLAPILCVGERERDANHEYISVVKKQIEECLRGVNKNLISKLIVAYEPVWAISSTASRRDATPADSKEMAIFIRRVLSDLSSPEIGSGVRILYGGSASVKNAKSFLEEGGVEGLLPGKASLDPAEFAEIVKICEASEN